MHQPAREAAAAAARGGAYAGFTCLHGSCDNVVFPSSTATLPGADNRPLRGTAHVHMVEWPESWAALQELQELLERADALPAGPLPGPARG